MFFRVGEPCDTICFSLLNNNQIASMPSKSPFPAHLTDPGQHALTVLMATFNGASHLKEQLDSLERQTFQNWELLVSDDGSTDATLAILEAFRDRVGPQRVVIRRGPSQGFVANFLSMACDPELSSDYFAFCDQDDIWELDKLERAVRSIDDSGSNEPALYCSRTRLVGDGGETLGYSPLFSRRPAFRNALVQSLAGGNTMVFNAAARQLLCVAGPSVSVASHDWWLYLLVTGVGGKVYYDAWPSVRYRQHADNLVGGNVGFLARIDRLRRLLQGRFRSWNDMHEAALCLVLKQLTPESQQLVRSFGAERRANLIGRMRFVHSNRLYRQTWVGNIGLYLSALINRF